MKPKFKRFNDLKPEDICFDFHIHTNWTDGKSTPEEIIKKASDLKLEAIAFTEHVNGTTKWFHDFKADIKKLRKDERMKIYVGVETKALDFKGTLDCPEEIMRDAELIVGSVHRYPDGKGGLININDIPLLGEQKAAETEFKLAIGLVKGNQIDILGHPFGVYSNFFSQFQLGYMKKLFSEASKRKVAVEINTKYKTARKEFFDLLRKINPYVSFGSDAHDANEITQSYEIIRREVKNED